MWVNEKYYGGSKDRVPGGRGDDVGQLRVGEVGGWWLEEEQCSTKLKWDGEGKVIEVMI